jgi:hypothetical protein
MSSKVKPDRARPVLPPGTTAPDKVKEGRDTLAKVKASANYAQAPEVQTAATSFENALNVLDGNNGDKQKAKDALQKADTNEPVYVRRVDTQRRALGSAIEIFADGSKDIVSSFGAAVAENHTSPEAITPENLHAMKSRTHDRAGVRWTPVPGAHGYILQHATNPNDPTTFSAEMPVSGAKLWLTGQTRGTTVYFRVLACDDRLPGGRTAYTAWVGVLVT